MKQTSSQSGTPHLDQRPSAVRLRLGDPVHRFPVLKEWPYVPRLENPELNISRVADGAIILRIPLEAGEALWGFGQRFDAFNLRGKKLESWTTDGWNADDTSYFAVPFFISSRGYGLFVNHTGRVRFDLGASQPGEILIHIPDESVEIFAFRGSPSEISRTYTETVGRPSFAPEWMYRPWISRNSYLGAHEVDRVVDRMQALGMPVGVVVLEAWAEELHNFRFSTHRYPDPVEWMQRLKAKNVRVINWITSSVWPGSLAYREAKEKGFLVLNPDGSEHVVRWLENGRKIDFRIPEARAWWRDLQKPVVAQGIDGFKTDGGEHMPDPYFHNVHSFYYQQASLDAFRETGREGITFSRSANAACARHGTYWAGDQDATWRGLKMAVRGGLSTALSGFPFWAHDIGAYTGNPTKELYLRWLQFGAFSPIMQFHGIEAREPWHFDEETIAIARFYFQVRDQLIPHLKRWGEEAMASGTPIIRPLVWHFPDDANTHDLDSQFMLGPDLMVAPVLDPIPGRSIYLPAGEWMDVWSGHAITGPAHFFHPASLHEIPVFARAENAASYRDLFKGASFSPPPGLSMALAGPANANGIIPRLRYWRNQPEAERLYYEIRNTTDREALLDIALQAPGVFNVTPPDTPRLLLQPNEVQRLAYSITPIRDLPPGSYPITLNVKRDHQSWESPGIEIILSPQWHVLGPFDGGVGSVQKLDGHDVNLKASYTGKRGRAIRWQPLPMDSMREDGRFDLTSMVGSEGSSSTFLYTTLWSDRERSILLKAGFGDCMVAWVNGEEIKVVYGHRNPERDEDVFEARLREGENHILIKNSRDLSPPYFYLRVSTPKATE